MGKKYEFTGETKDWFGSTLKRIRAVRDFALKCGMWVVKGDLGGWIEKEENLSHSGSAWVGGEARVHGDAAVHGDAWVYGDAEVCGKALVNGDAEVSGNAEVYSDAEVSDRAWVYGKARVYGKAKVYGDAMVGGNAEVDGCAKVLGDAKVFGDALVCGDAKVEKSFDVVWFKNIWSSGRTFTYTRSNGKWAVGCFYGTGEELIVKAYADSELSGTCYEAIVEAVEKIYGAMKKAGK